MVDATPLGHQAFLIELGDRKASPDATVVLLHGFPESSYSFAGAFPLLGERFDRVICFDFIGFGFSDKPKRGFAYSLVEQADVALRLIREAGVRGCHFVAHDMGDSVMTEILARVNDNPPDWFEEGIRSVTFTNGSMVMDEARLRLGQKALISPLGGLLARITDSPAIFRKQVLSAQGNSKLGEEQILDMYSAATSGAPRGLMADLAGYIKERLRYEQPRWLPALRDATMPVHIAWGRDDAVAPLAIAEHLKREVKPEARLTVIEGLGHFSQIQDPGTWFAALSPFWDQ